MELETLDVVIKIAACVCGKDGIISQEEEKTILNIVTSINSKYSLKRFDQIIDEFFDEALQIEDYLEQISGVDLNKFTIELCESSASADGLDIRENIALNKVKIILGGEL